MFVLVRDWIVRARGAASAHPGGGRRQDFIKATVNEGTACVRRGISGGYWLGRTRISRAANAIHGADVHRTR